MAREIGSPGSRGEDGPGPFPHDFAQELKRPLSRKKAGPL